MNVHAKRWARPLALFIALTMVMMYSFGGVAFAEKLTNQNGSSQSIEERGNNQNRNGNDRGGNNDNDRGGSNGNDRGGNNDNDRGGSNGHDRGDKNGNDRGGNNGHDRGDNNGNDRGGNNGNGPGGNGDNNHGGNNGNGPGGNTEQTYKVTYNKNGGDIVKSYLPGVLVTVAEAAEGYNAWALNGNDKDLGPDGKIFMPGDTFTMPRNNLNFKAVNTNVTPTTYTVTYAPGTQGTFTTVSNIGLTSGAVTPTPPATPGNSGYTFAGWNPELTPTVTGNVTYVAQWTADPTVTTYTVIYAPGTQGTFTTVSNIGLTSGAVTPTPPATPGYSGYTFAGWNPELTPTVTGNVTYVAQWTADPTVTTYTVTYLPGTHGTFAATSTSGLTSGTPTPTAPEVTGLSGYTFTGWSPTWSATVSGNAIYTAQWSQNQTTTGNTGGGGGGTGGGGGGGTTTTITDPEPPLAEIPETETPLVEAPEVTLEEQPIPLADVPQTGDNTNIWLLLALMMGSGAGIVLLGRRKETVEK